MADARRFISRARVLGSRGGNFGTRLGKLARARLALRVERVEVRARRFYLSLKLRSLCLRLLVRGGCALAFARQPLGLRRKFFESRFELTTDFGQALRRSRVRQKLAARALD